MEHVTKYVLGFAFSPDQSKVLLIRKLRPSWQAGKLNGIGGKVEGDELFNYAMSREFKEETNINVDPLAWQRYWTHDGHDYTLRCFTTRLDFAQCKQLDQLTDEKPGWYEVKSLGTTLLVDGVPGTAMYVAGALNHKNRPFYTTTVES